MVRWTALATLACVAPLAAGAQSATDDESFEWRYEVDVSKRLSAANRLIVPVRLVWTPDDNTREAMAGALLDHRFSDRLTARVGYRYERTVSTPDTSREHRAIVELTPRFRPGGAIALVDRSRVDLRWVDGVYSWRYRNRLRVERPFVFTPARPLTPYAMFELGFDSRYDTVNRSRFDVGASYVFTRHVTLDAYGRRQRDTRSSIARTWAAGLTLTLSY